MDMDSDSLPKPSVALVDDHILLRNGLANIIRNFQSHDILFEADNGRQCVAKLEAGLIPSIVLLDINMPEMDGYSTAMIIKSRFPQVKVLALSMYDSENSIIRMLRSGARGYILKDSDPGELQQALSDVQQKGYYQSEMITSRLIRLVNDLDNPEGQLQQMIHLNEREIEFLKLSCTELTYKEIADRMGVSPRTVDGYRDTLFEKLPVKTRVGLVLYAIRSGLVMVG
ncbi:MAG TPA: response regulator transcription factor [Puia sp.]|jgi:DNA-binding NarL/FixJ family response regulator|uniref:response regulator transcription factor n=1 Tax=Puia sp. TaxID=2045100 RepID=UPI002C355593|nr:response regulator transcription factor [Puia sp.]HVU95460.1 response regulator transcription factor [Puia sp.]